MTYYMPSYQTAHPPHEKPLMVWDGDCGFCRYWITQWEQYFGHGLAYEPYQQAADRFPDLDRELFKGAVQLIDTDGQVYPGAAAVFRGMCAGNNRCWPEQIYKQSDVFRDVSDAAYHLVSSNRSFLYKVTMGLFGKDPNQPKRYWLGYLGALAAVTGVAVAIGRSRK